MRRSPPSGLLTGPTCGTCLDGSLLHIRDTYAVETAWAPKWVGDELRQVRAGAAEARLAAIRADAEATSAGRRGREDLAAQHEVLSASYRAMHDAYREREDVFGAVMDDWAEWAELRARSRAFLTPWEPTWPEDSLGRDHFRRRLRQQAREWRSGEAYGLFVFTNEGRRLAGGINLSNVRRGVAQAASVGYWMGQPYAGQGLMTDALRGVLPFVFDDLRLHRLEAACLPHNEPSKAVLGKVGFHEEGLARQYLRINGQWADHLLFALLRADYDTLLRSAR